MKRLLSAVAAGILLLTASAATPDTTETDVISDTTAEVVFTVKDVRDLQDHLLAKPLETDLSGKPYDLNGDGVWDVFDLALMKREIPTQPEQAAHGDTIVVYFSRTNNTEKIAQYLIDLTGADSYEIEAAMPYSDADINYSDSACRANQEQTDKSVRPEIADPIASLDGYDTVFLGYPIWWGQEPRIIDTFLESYDFSDKTVIPFCTSGSSGIATSEQQIASLVPIGEQLAGRRFAASATKEDVQAWYDTLPLAKEETAMMLQIQVGNKTLTASLADTEAAQELAKQLKTAPVTVTLNEYGGFEKVGKLPWSLTRTDEQISTESGDIMLYQGNQMTIFYEPNAWSYTRLGHIENVTQEELRSILGDGNVEVVLSLQ